MAEGFDPSYGDHEARVVLDTVVETTLGPDRAHQVGRRVVCDLPANALLDAAEGADLLVVGTHERHALQRLLTGSVSTTCVKHALCPTVVVHPDGTAEEEHQPAHPQ